MIILKNDFAKASISAVGAELKSLTVDGTEFIWQGDPSVWKFSAPMVFPICGMLKDGKFIYKGKEYFLEKHGFARMESLDVISALPDAVTFRLASSDALKASYPFDFELRVIYTLKGRTLSVKYEVENKGEDTMYFSIGSHEAYSTPEGIENYELVFDKPVSLLSTVIDDALTTDATVPFIENSESFALCERDLDDGAIVFRGVPERSVTLRQKDGARSVRVDFPDMKNMLIWHVSGAPYICIEPWSGMPDSNLTDGRIENKLEITALSPAQIYENEHKITFNV